MKSKLPERLKQERKWKELTQAQLGKAVGLDQRFIANIETGKKSVSIETLILFVEFFECTAGYLIGTED